MKVSHQLDRLLAQALTLRVAVALGASTLVTAGVAGPLALQARNAEARQQEIVVEGSTQEAENVSGGESEGALSPDQLPVIPSPATSTTELAKAVDVVEPSFGNDADAGSGLMIVPTPSPATDDAGTDSTEPNPTIAESVVATDQAGAATENSPPTLAVREPVADPTSTSSTEPVDDQPPAQTTAPEADPTEISAGTIPDPGAVTPPVAPTTNDDGTSGPATATTERSEQETTTTEPVTTTSTTQGPSTGADTTSTTEATTTTAVPRSTTIAPPVSTTTTEAPEESTAATEGTETGTVTEPGIEVGSTLPTEILWSFTRTGVGEDKLEGAILTGPVFVHLGRSPEIASVVLRLDDPLEQEDPVIDSARPFTSLLPVDSLINGEHRLDVRIMTEDGEQYELVAFFEVDRAENVVSEVEPTTTTENPTTAGSGAGS